MGIARNLTVHPCSEIRIYALSCLLSAVNEQSAKTVNYGFLCDLAAYHVDTDARARSDFISIVKNFFIKMNTVLHKSLRTLNLNASLKEYMEESSAPLKGRQRSSFSAELDAHILSAFQFYTYLCSELQPTASYQRHIVALKLLNEMLSTEMSKLSQVGLSPYFPLASTHLLSIKSAPISISWYDPF